MNTLIQKSTYRLLTIIVLFTLVFSFGNQTYAQSTSSQDAQIQTLLEMVKQLQTQLATLGGTNVSTGQCVSLSRSLYLGVSDSESLGEVSKLQRFLTSTGHYTYGEITGYFGPSTQSAVQAWQSSNKIVTTGSPETTGYGVVGPSTRNALARGCVSQSAQAPSTTNSPTKAPQVDSALQAEIDRLTKMIQDGDYGEAPIDESSGDTDEELQEQIDALIEMIASGNTNSSVTKIDLRLEGENDEVVADIDDYLNFSYTVSGNADNCTVNGEYRNGTLAIKATNANFTIGDTSGTGAFYVSYVYPYDILEEVTVECKDGQTGTTITSSVDVKLRNTDLADYKAVVNGKVIETAEDITEAEAHSRCMKEANDKANNGLRMQCTWNGDTFEDMQVNTGKG